MNTSSMVRVTHEGPVALVRMNNPATLNAMDQDMGPALCRALEGLASQDSVRVLVLCGAGGVFSAGGNLARVGEHLEKNPGQGAGVVFAQYTKWVSRLLAALEAQPQPVIAAVQGAASGAGLGWLLACDLAVLDEDCKLVPGFLALGLPPGAGVSLTLARAVGSLKAMELLALNQTLSPHEALELGLVNRLAPGPQVVPQALAWAQELAQGPPRALATTRRRLGAAWLAGLPTQLEDERRQVMAAADLPQFRRRVRSFLER